MTASELIEVLKSVPGPTLVVLENVTLSYLQGPDNQWADDVGQVSVVHLDGYRIEKEKSAGTRDAVLIRTI